MEQWWRSCLAQKSQLWKGAWEVSKACRGRTCMQHGAGGGNSTISGCRDQGVDLTDSRRGSSAWEGWNLGGPMITWAYVIGVGAPGGLDEPTTCTLRARRCAGGGVLLLQRRWTALGAGVARALLTLGGVWGKATHEHLLAAWLASLSLRYRRLGVNLRARNAMRIEKRDVTATGKSY